MKLKVLVACFLLFSFTSTVHAQNTEIQTTAKATPAEIELQVTEQFADTPELIAIARCESMFRQFTDAGNVFYGGYGGNMVGVFQFYESVHKDSAQQLGYDLTTVDGNLAYAQHLYNQSGTTPWNSSRSCWEDSLSDTTDTEVDSNSGTTTNSTSLSKAQMLEQIALLEQLIELLKTLLALQN